ncbi:hypothetical protein KB206_05245 [Microvirga sp. STS02]|uniref:hypothetical protein n=1 Tax=Hymenobacter negativus TaxID=2795026 RepID=UPI0018DBC3ED|nr:MULTISPECIES: hypothetical protein [Bacteria]MBH8568277.1 hypothetical protein [Hymenobacter negativus]MBR7208012.1 hypothetical protein [Microvirga sp. STS02]
MRPLFFTFCLAALPLLFGFWVNETASHPPTTAYVATRCTRYCYAHACPHATAANSPAYVRLRPLYRLTIAALSLGGRGRYGLVNVVFYLLLVPAVLLWLTYSTLRNARTLRQLKQRRA